MDTWDDSMAEVSSAVCNIRIGMKETNDELFYAEEQRHVKKDNTFSFKNVRYEPDTDLRNKTITIRFDRNKLDRVVVYYKSSRIGDAKPLDLIANSKIKRRRPVK